MNDEYDFSKARRGKFFRKGASLVPPVRPERLAQLRAIPDSEIDTSDIPETGETFQVGEAQAVTKRLTGMCVR